jgi:hypothetical protein
MNEQSQIVSAKIHPAIGVARVGNSPEYFLGPEIPGVRPTGPFRDAEGRIKRQAVRYRVFGYDAQGRAVKELTARDADITWTVHVTNGKAASQFSGLRDKKKIKLRNRKVKNRAELIIDPGPRSIRGRNQSAPFDGGKFRSLEVPLGRMLTEDNEDARLIVLGGFGQSACEPKGAPVEDYESNDYWHDDTSDGSVSAQVTLKDDRALPTLGAWLVVAPPDFAPAIDPIVTLYDLLYDAAIRQLDMTPLRPRPSFTHDIAPILQRMVDMGWVNQGVADHHTYFARVWMRLRDNAEEAKAMRASIFNRLRHPSSPRQAEGRDGKSRMPKMHGDYGEGSFLTLTRTQYEMMRQWYEGNFDADWNGKPEPASEITPDGLDRAVTEACVGAPFFPGIEVSRLLVRSSLFIEPFRINHAKVRPGDVTKGMAVPWQADFYDCHQRDESLPWWPAQRPDHVLRQIGDTERVKWERGVGDYKDMVKKWHLMGYVLREGDQFVEKERLLPEPKKRSKGKA